MKVIFTLVPLLALCAVTSVASYWQNDWDKPHSHQCPNNEHVTRIESIHTNPTEDRRWKVTCGGNVVDDGTCSWTADINKMDETIYFMCGDDRVIAGMGSYHDNRFEDRRYKFRCCKINADTPRNCHVTNWKNTWDDPLNLHVPDSKVVMGVFSEHSNTHEDRRFRFIVCEL